jgi:hypothetical protein
LRKIKILLLVSFAVLSFVLDSDAQSETRVEQEHAYSEDEKNDWKDNIPGNVDWAVYFKYPANVRRVVVNSRGETERAVLSRSTIDDNYMYRGERYVKVLTGWGARRAANYKGSRQTWANSLRLIYYAPFQPRGPERRGGRP